MLGISLRKGRLTRKVAWEWWGLIFDDNGLVPFFSGMKRHCCALQLVDDLSKSNKEYQHKLNSLRVTNGKQTSVLLGRIDELYYDLNDYHLGQKEDGKTIDRLKRDKARLKKELQSALDERDRFCRETALLRVQVEDREGDIGLLSNACSDLEEDKKGLKREISLLRAQIEDREGDIHQLSRSNKYLEEQNSLYNEELQRLTDIKIEYEETIKRLQAKYHNLMAKRMEPDLLRECSRKDVEIARLQGELTHQEVNSIELQEQVRAVAG